jgi:hypothetical protein
MNTKITWKSNEKFASFFQMVGTTQNNQFVISKPKEEQKYLLKINGVNERYYFDSVKLAQEWCENFTIKK